MDGSHNGETERSAVGLTSLAVVEICILEGTFSSPPKVAKLIYFGLFSHTLSCQVSKGGKRGEAKGNRGKLSQVRPGPPKGKNGQGSFLE